MLLIAKLIGKILAILNGEISPNQIAAGFAYGAILGLVPAVGLLPIVLLLFAFIVNINLAMMFVAAGAFKLLAFGVDPLANQIGFVVLTKIPALKSSWIALANTPLVPYTRFNNTIVMGSLLTGIVLWLPLFILGKWAVVRYRNDWRERILKLRVVQILKASAVYRFYEMYQGIRGG